MENVNGRRRNKLTIKKKQIIKRKMLMKGKINKNERI